ncbi:MAG: S8 family serine peptidase [Bacteroidia bacterium]|nr:S8 family serine peptidase [Bacteroidia bacterium]MDW8333860.1 S8 family serine peptidase [Bacteroidia bacterium]
MTRRTSVGTAAWTMLVWSAAFAQPYWVEFKDKGDATGFDPYAYFAPEAVQRHCLEYGAEFDSVDLPVCERYLEAVRAEGAQTGYASRWLNGVWVADGRVECLAALPCVARVYNLRDYARTRDAQICGANRKCARAPRKPKLFDDAQTTHRPAARSEPPANARPQNPRTPQKPRARHATGPILELARAQLARMQVEKLWQAGYNGAGVTIAVLDVGFWGVNKAPEFAHLFAERRIVATRDFVRDRDGVFGWSDHGTQTLSCIAGMTAETALGAAPAARFLLARTERVLYEPLVEELWWLEAAEWAERNGAHIINSSLGYGDDRYDYRHMDGQFSIVARAAVKAVSRGLLVVNAAGNEGANKWKYITTPADAPGVLSVGGTDPATDAQIAFSSMGPTADGRLKPELCAYAKVAARGRSRVGTAFGTSFSAPLVAGFAAAVKQMHPDWTVKQLFDALCRSGHLYPYFDYSHGYGVPQADKILRTPPDPPPTFSFLIDDGLIAVSIDRDALAPKKANLYWHVQGTDGRLRIYGARRVYDERTVRFPGLKLERGETLRVHFEGFTGEYAP